MALGGSEIFVFKFESDNLLGFMHKIELAQVNFNSETFQEPWEEGPLSHWGIRGSFEDMAMLTGS